MDFEFFGILRENNGTRIKSGEGVKFCPWAGGGTRNFIKKRKCFKKHIFSFLLCVKTIAITRSGYKTNDVIHFYVIN